jgi:plasmid rolling circle replication initiator protein Rep
MKYNKKKSFLLDPKENGKERPWRSKKVRSLIIAASFARLDEPKRSERIKNCGTFLEFTRELKTDVKRLTAANFCRERLCPMCQWRRSLKVFYQVSQVMDVAEQRQKKLVPLFLTLTMRNCDGANLADKLGEIFKGWNRFLNDRTIKPLIVGWFRSLEITYNKKRDDFHPHLHILLFVDKSYFKKGAYLKAIDWVKLWRRAAGLDYDPICDIRRVNNKGKRKAVAEVAKYTLKDTEYADAGDNALTDRLVAVLGKSLKGRRLYAFGGILKALVADFEAVSGVENATIRGDVAAVIERYRWSFGFMNYERV